jgi:O-acetyl-ADP-ribose deacetylase (regulator of RNase III)
MIKIIDKNNSDNTLECFSGLSTLYCNVEDLMDSESRPIYFVSPSNAKLFYDGGIDAAYLKMFGSGLQQKIQRQMRGYQEMPESLLGQKYLPVGAAMLHKISGDYYIIASPTMLMPQVVSSTNNAYYAMKAVLKV